MYVWALCHENLCLKGLLISFILLTRGKETVILHVQMLGQFTLYSSGKLKQSLYGEKYNCTFFFLHLNTDQNLVFRCFVFINDMEEYESAEAKEQGCCPDMEYFTVGFTSHFSDVKIFSYLSSCCIMLCCSVLCFIVQRKAAA